MSGGFFGFDSSLPERRGGPPGPPGPAAHSGSKQPFVGFEASTNEAFGNAGAEEDLAVYQWGDNMGGSLLEGGDDMNDETFGNLGEISNDFQFSSQPAAPSTKPSKPAGKIASTESRYKPRVAYDPFAASEDDFYASRPTSKKTAKPAVKSKPVTTAGAGPSTRSSGATQQQQHGSLEHLWAKPGQSQQPMWGAASSSATNPPVPPPTSSSSAPPPPGHIKSLEEIEAEMSQVAVNDAPDQRKVLTLEEIERQMMDTPEPAAPPAPASAPQISVPAPPPMTAPGPGPIAREATPTQTPGLAGSGYASQQALLDKMFPELGAAPSGQTPSFPNAPAANGQAGSAPAPGPGPGPIPLDDQMERYKELHDRIRAKIESMSKYNNLMGSSDKDFVTRIQLSQLATTDPYASDFYAQVFSIIQRSRMAAQEGPGGPAGPSVVQLTSGLGFGVGGPNASRFGKMGSNTMQKLSTQVKKLVEARQQKASQTSALQGALGKVTRGGTTGPRPVLAVPMPARNEARPASALNQQSGIRRQPLTKKQTMYALEELYDSILDLEQKRREMPPPTAVEEVETWNAQCNEMVEVIWKRLMVMEPLDVSDPHPFISLMNPSKGQRLFNRVIRHLTHQQCLTLLTLLIATYPQLDVIARAPPPPVTDSSLLTKADRLDRARREAETDSFLHNVIPGVDVIINRCSLALVAGLLGLCSQRMDIVKVASSRPGIALFTALLSRAQSLKSAPPPPDPTNPSQPQQGQGPEPAELEQWSRQYAYFLQTLLPHLASLFPSSIAQKTAFGPGAYLLGGDQEKDRDSIEMERRDAEVWGFVAALAVNAPEEEQMNLVAALREKILHTVQLSRQPSTPPFKRDIMLRNVNMFLNGLGGLDASMIE